MAGTAGTPRSTKDRMLDSAAVLLRERGVAGVTVDAVLAHSGAPRGSVYHHFPGGRDELLLGALARAGAFVTGKLERAAEDGDPRRAVDSFVRFWKRALAESDFRAGCPAVAVAVDSRPSVPGAEDLVREVFRAWHVTLVRLLTADGHPAARAERLSTLCVAAIEGAVVLCRASGDVQALDDVAAELDAVLARPGGPTARTRRPRTTAEHEGDRS